MDVSGKTFLCLMGVAAAWMGSFLIAHLRRNLKVGGDSHTKDKPQRMHQHDVCRLGGLGIMFGLVVYAVLSTAPGDLVLRSEPFPVWVVFVGLPVFLLGVLEDFTGAVSPRYRLGAAMLSAWAASYFLSASLPFPHGGPIVQVCLILFTGFCVAGVVNAFNIIDGLNGLASGMALLALGMMGWVANVMGDLLLVQLALGTGAAVLGFLLVNFPHGRLFLGDGGAYLLGFLIAEMAVMLVVRHPTVSWFFPLACVIYPVTETLFSMYRRKVKKADAQKPDALHLHSLVHRRLNRWRSDSPSKAVFRNSLSTTFFWCWQILSSVILFMIWDRPIMLIGYCIVQVGVYLGLYRMLTRFKSPVWMRLITRPDVIQTEFQGSDWSSTDSSKT